uniref:Uncharacterized protein n=1 Tax=Triticum urartu TaxID=4572 RepID=A0A8R7QLR6_TRIUA
MENNKASKNVVHVPLLPPATNEVLALSYLTTDKMILNLALTPVSLSFLRSRIQLLILKHRMLMGLL